MEEFRQFLDTSTIHGLSYLTSTKKSLKFFWILIVIAGFSGAFTLILESFQNWNETPITTAIKTIPISKLTLPKIIVCPPKDNVLNLNYDIAQSENIILDGQKREELLNFSIDAMQVNVFEDMLKNLRQV